MNKKETNISITANEQLAGIIAMAVVNEAETLLHEVPKITKDKLVVKQTVTDDKVVFTVKGDLGDKLNNPDITFMFDDNLTSNDLATETELNDLVYKNYITLSLMRYTVNTQEDNRENK